MGCRSIRTVVFCVANAAIFLAGCGGRNSYVPPPPPEVIVTTPLVKNETLYHEFPGTTQASQSVNIIPRVLGYIDSLHFTDGSMVSQGQLLFIIDPRPYQDALDVAIAQVSVAEAAYDDAKANYARALQVAKTPGAIAKQQVDTYKATLEQSQANVQLAKANQANAQLNVDFTHITAPISGKISRRLVDIGNLVTANSTLLTTINQYDPMYAYFNVSESDFLDYQKRQREAAEKEKSQSPGTQPQAPEPVAAPSPPTASANSSDPATQAPQPSEKHPVEMGLSDETGYPHEGTIDFADNQIDTSTGTLLIRGVFANPQPYVLAPGLFVRIRVPIGTQTNAVLVPDRAIATDQQGKYLLVVQTDHTVEHRSVSVGSVVAGDMCIVNSGIKPGEQFIVEGLQFARPGLKVNPVMKPAESFATSQAATANPPVSIGTKQK